uniref:Ig-like domain-containing protein n=1 Tax=Oreochromis aureus TaxID=47969 RepID=A0A668S8B4_OREAU
LKTLHTHVVDVLGALSAAGEDFFAKVGGKVTLNCGVSSYRRSLQWHHGNDFLHSNMFFFSVLGTADLSRRSVVRQTNLEISSVKETDAGRFTCSADGTLLVSVKPSAVLELNDEAKLQCEVKGQHQGCEVKWRSPNTYSLTNPSTVQLKPVKTSHNGAWECIVTCGRNTFSERLTIKVKGNTQLLGMKTFVCICGQRNIKMCTANDCPLGLSCSMWFVIGVCCQCGMLLIVCVTVLCKCIKRRSVCEERRSSNIYV